MYKLITNIRNWAFNKGFLPQTKVRDKVIALGNLSTGGTGKTPHTLFLGELLSAHASIKVLSRGYGRKSSGFRKVEISSSPMETGDEPLMIKTRHPEWEVAVCESRVDGAQKMSSLIPPEVLLLDDAYQHRHISRNLNVLLSRFDKPFFDDQVLPFGRLREGRKGASRAAICIVSHCPDDIGPEQFGYFKEEIQKYTDAHIFFSSMKSKGIFDLNGRKLEKEINAALILAGIAHPKSFSKQIRVNLPKAELQELFFTDHHEFSEKDCEKIEALAMAADNTILTTEKDIVRLPNRLKNSDSIEILYQPINVEILQNREEELLNLLLSHLSLTTKL